MLLDVCCCLVEVLMLCFLDWFPDFLGNLGLIIWCGVGIIPNFLCFLVRDLFVLGNVTWFVGSCVGVLPLRFDCSELCWLRFYDFVFFVILYFPGIFRF